jgi:alpha-tubulin suppressor-like RCC1 family protein
MIEAESWPGILAMACGARHLIALGETGQILSACDEKDAPCAAASHFVLFRDVRQLYGYGQYSRRLQQELYSLQLESRPAQNESAYRPNGRSAGEIARWACGRFAIGMAHAIWLDDVGNLHQEGANDCGQCDLPSYEHATYVAAGPYRSAVILKDGQIVMAGRNNDGQGDAEALNREAFAEISPSDAPDETYESSQGSDSVRWTQVSCGHTHTAALREDGRVFAVGADPDGRCATAEWRDITHLCCGVRHTVGLRADGSCVAVGDNRYGQCNVTDWNSVVSIAAGEFHTVGLCANGRLLATGDNRKGQCDLADLEDVVAIACLPEATLCVLSSGRVVLRGGTGELNRAVDALRDVIGVSACEHRIAAKTATGELIILPE